MELMICKICGCRDLNKKNVIDWDVANCPICGTDLKEQLKEEPESEDCNE